MMTGKLREIGALRILVLGTLVFVAGMAGSLSTAAYGEDFRIDNRIFATGHADPDSQSTTIFAAGLVYDFLNEPAEVIVYDPAGRQFQMLDLGRKVRTALSTDEVRGFTQRIKQYTTQHSNPMVNWLGTPSFKESFDAQTSEVTLRGQWMTYRAKTLTVGPKVAAQYREFADVYAGLNVVLNPGARPPFARLALNEAIARHDALAKEVRLTVAAKSSQGATQVRSEHELSLHLTAADKARVEEARRQSRDFTEVAFVQYRKAGK